MNYEVNIDELDFKLRDELNEYLRELVESGGSDLHVKSGSIIRKRVKGQIVPIENSRNLTSAEGITLAKELLRGRFREFVERKSIDFTHKLNENYRFRVNMFFQMDGMSAVFRVIPTKLPSFEDLKLPVVIKKLCENAHRGIILVTGPTGSGKTTTLASMINYINQHKKKHIITIEDPIEFVYKDDQCIINQRSIGQDAIDFSDALRGALREDPDIILVGEMRDLETIETALHAAETGHLVLSTLHTIDAKETIGRVVSMFPSEEQNRIRGSLSSVIQAVISQRLCVRADADGRRAALEIMVSTPRIRDLILEGKDSQIYDAINEAGELIGMQTFDKHLLELYKEGIISQEEALEKSTKRNDLEIKIKSVNLGKTSEDTDPKDAFKDQVIALKF